MFDSLTELTEKYIWEKTQRLNLKESYPAETTWPMKSLLLPTPTVG